MKVFLERLWREPVLMGAVVLAVINGALFLPDWRAAAGSLAATLAAAVGIRSRVSPR